ncbi:hypothetical protein ABTP76_20035, partial [Acinetobacter baumannii]
FGRKSPVPVHSKLFFLEIKSAVEQTISIGKDLFGEAAMYVLEGTVNIEGNDYGTKQLLIAKNATLCEFTLRADTSV